MHDFFEAAQSLLPEGIRHRLSGIKADRSTIEELRLRTGFPPTALICGREIGLGGKPVVLADIAHVLEKASRCSIHSVQQELQQGFITADMGIRIGLCGTLSGGQLRDFSSVAIRIPHEIRGIGEGAINALRPFDESVVIVSPPGGGKTTFLRELVRTASQSGRRVCVCDERREIASAHQGNMGFDLGPHTDVLSGAGKAEGIMMLLRAMNPEIIALDEISCGADMAAMVQAAGCGAVIFATVHGRSLEQLRKRAGFEELLSLGVFQKAVIIGTGGERRYEVVDICLK